MSNPKLSGREYDDARRWINRQLDEQHVPIQDLYYARRGTREELQEFLKLKKELDFWPKDFDVDDWHDLVEEIENDRKHEIDIEARTNAAVITNENQLNVLTASTDSRSAWQLYRKHLLEDLHFSQTSVDLIQNAAKRTLRMLSTDTSTTGPRRGLIVGNVQSGKTANMAGLMSMAADAGFNMFIVLTGTIENLRVQTQTRLYNDLNSPGNLHWQNIEHPAPGAKNTSSSTSTFHLATNDKDRYMIVCLKQSSRLKALYKWLREDPKKMSQMRILLIDDEADQASINTADIADETQERKAINRLILDIVFGAERKSATYGAMNYISYTATPYGNCLNESGPRTLYPASFIQTLATPDSYFGPDKMYDSVFNGPGSTLDMVRQVPDDDVQIIAGIQSGDDVMLPDSLQSAIMWYLCGAAALRFHGFRRPTSMLIHTSRTTEDHAAVANAVSQWITESRPHLIEWCRGLYETERRTVTKELLRDVYPDYEYPDSTIFDYPEFDDIVPFIRQLIESVTHVHMDDDSKFQYNRQLHLCIDNCMNNRVSADGTYMRLVYPSEQELDELEFGPAFIVVGGNTLSRGLTLQGLISTYFLRSTVRQGDTLMQMGRWFGYRRHYELYPRVWMSNEIRDKFCVMTDIDIDLRRQISNMANLGQKPREFQLAILTSPTLTWLRLTSPGKMQGAVLSEVDFAGTHTQLTTYARDKGMIDENLRRMTEFLGTLGQGEMSDNPRVAACVWRSIPYDRISEGLFDNGFRVAPSSRVFQQFGFINEWVSRQTRNGHMERWNVIACGIRLGPDSPKDMIWTLPDGNQLLKIQRSCVSDDGAVVNIGALSTRLDYVADIKRSMLSEKEWNEMQKYASVSLPYAYYRDLAGIGKVPLLLLYRIYANSKPREGSTTRTDLRMPGDLVGVTMVYPGVRTGKTGRYNRLVIRNSGEGGWHVED